MKKALIIFLFISTYIFGQVGYVEYNNPVYRFLKRMDSFHFISGYDEFELPKTRREIASYLKEVINSEDKLSAVDRGILNDLKTEFEFELYGTTENFSSFTKNGFNNLLSQKENFLYYFNDKGKFNTFVNFVADGKYFGRSWIGDSVKNTSIFNFGGIARFSFYDKIGFSVKATNGTFLGNRDLAASTESRKYNFKIHTTTSSNLGNDFFDETEGYLLADFDFLKFKIGRDRQIIGYQNFHPLLSTFSPPVDYIQLNLKYKKFGFSFFHGKLLGTLSVSSDSIQGNVNSIFDKYISYHRFHFDLSRHFKIGAGEIIVYANRGIDFSYLNPFNFYKSAEHANQDRDNSMLFFDFTNNSFDGLKIYVTLLIDDIDFGKLGTGWYGNQTLLHTGIYSSQLYNLIPIEMELDYLRIDPYVFTHRLNYNNYTNFGYGIGVPVQPNSSSIGLRINYYPHHRLSAFVKFVYTVHGANKVDKNGKVINYGGDILLGHRLSDSETVYFLEGVREYSRNLFFNFSYEPYNNIFVFLSLNYSHESLRGNVNRKTLDSKLGLKIKI